MRETLKKKIEILSPAGSAESLRAAVCAGADAVYAGGSRFGARAFANNLTEEEMLEAIDYVHLHGRKIYLTVNTLLKEREIADELYTYLEPFYLGGLDAVIVQDLGVLSFVRKYFPGLPIHASTQMTVTNVLGAQFLREQGVERVVTARELQLDEVRAIAEQTGLEVESFVHGALCYCYSGQCLYSSLIGGRSGNRGQCAQPCRLPYTAGTSGKPSYLMSLKDICTLEQIPELVDSGIHSFKIEGRMKKPEYVAAVTAMYRKYVDLYLENGKKNFHVRKQDKELLMDLYNRGGFHGGYYHTRNGREMLSLTRPNHAGVEAVRVLGHKGKQVQARAVRPLSKGDVIELPDGKETYTVGQNVREGGTFSFVTHERQQLQQKMLLPRTRNAKVLEQIKIDFLDKKIQEKINGKLNLSVGKSAILELTYKNLSVNVSGAVVEEARSAPMERARIETQMRKTGNTPFQFDRLDILLSGNVFLPLQQLNELRREGLERLEKEITGAYRREKPARMESGREAYRTDRKERFREEGAFPDRRKPSEEKPRICVQAEQRAQLELLASVPWVHRVYMECSALTSVLTNPETWELVERLRGTGKEVFLAMPHIFREDTVRRYEKEYRALELFDGVLVRNLESVQFLRTHSYPGTVTADHHIYQFNHYAKEFWKAYVDEQTAPLELNARELGETGCSDMELVVYGYLPMMVSAQCIRKTIGGCVGQTGYLTMTDRVGKSFAVKNYCEECYNMIYNTTPLVLAGQTEERRRLSPAAVRLSFTTESTEQMREVLRLYERELADGETVREIPMDFTRGHFKRGIK